MDKEEDVYMYTHAHTMEYYSAIKKSENAICSNMDGPRDYHAEWSKGDRNSEWHPEYAESKKKWYKRTYLQIKTDLENQLTVAWRWGWGEERGNFG